MCKPLVGQVAAGSTLTWLCHCNAGAYVVPPAVDRWALPTRSRAALRSITAAAFPPCRRRHVRLPPASAGGPCPPALALLCALSLPLPSHLVAAGVYGCHLLPPVDLADPHSPDLSPGLVSRQASAACCTEVGIGSVARLGHRAGCMGIVCGSKMEVRLLVTCWTCGLTSQPAAQQTGLAGTNVTRSRCD